MSHRTLLFSLAISLSLLNTHTAQTMSWDFWTRNNYQNTWIAGGSAAAVGLIYYIWQYVNRPEAPEACYARVQRVFNDLRTKYDAKIAAFEQGYNITGTDLTSKNEQLESARQEWLAHIDEQALAHLGSFSGNWRANLSDDVKKLSAAKIDLSKMRRQVQEKNKNVPLAKRMEKLQSDVAILFLQMSLLKDCVKHNESYLNLLDNESYMSSRYGHVVNIAATQTNLKQIICNHSAEKSHQYIKFIQNLSEDLIWFGQKLNQSNDIVKSTKLFQRAQQVKNALKGIEKRIFADKTLHHDLRDYQTELLSQIQKKARELSLAADRAQNQANNVRGLLQRLHMAVITYQAAHAGNHQNNNNNNNYQAAISDWEINKLRTLSQEIEKIFPEIEKARESVRSLEKERTRMHTRFDTVNLSVPEQLNLQNSAEQTIQNAQDSIQTMRTVEQNARKLADDLHYWARRNGLFLV